MFGARRHTTESEKQRIVRMYVDEKMPVSAIQKRVQRGYKFVHRVLREAGVVLRTNEGGSVWA
jgi:molecular chaperone GrpE (heat shock protein)